jgi:ferredoxin
MCNFCIQHGDGRRWYLNASNYSLDLEADLRQRGFMVDFVRNFEQTRRTINAGLSALRFVPRPAHAWLAERASTILQQQHFGQPVPIEECDRILGIATNITLLPCVCRGAMQPGSNAESCCIIMTVKPSDAMISDGFRDYAAGPDAQGFHKLTREQALSYLQRAEERGLCHTAWTFITPFIAAICNCNLASGCMAMKIQLKGGVRIMWKGEDVARLNDDLCTRCGRCLDQCPFGAIRTEERRGRMHFDRLLCWGCGICRSVCKAGAVTLEPRSASADVAAVW